MVRVDDEFSPKLEQIPISGKTVLITGASRDFGAGIAKVLAREGAIVIGTYRDKNKRAQTVADEIEGEGGKITFFRADITQEIDRNRLFRVSKELGGIDHLVLNAAGASRELNVIGNTALVDIVLPAMKEGGRIVFIQSSPGHFFEELSDGIIPKDYIPVASSKYEAEKTLQAKIAALNQHGVYLTTLVLPEIEGTSNIRIFKKKDPEFTTKLEEIAEGYGHTVLKLSIGDGARQVLNALQDPFQKNPTIVV